MFYGAPVTAPMEIPVEAPPSYTRYDLPEIGNPNAMSELPEMVDASLKGIRLQGTLAKALPGMTEAGYMTNVRQADAAELMKDMRAASDIMKPQERRSRAVARAKNRRAQTIAENVGKGSGRQGVKASQFNEMRGNNMKYRGAQNLSGPSAFPYLTYIR